MSSKPGNEVRCWCPLPDWTVTERLLHATVRISHRQGIWLELSTFDEATWSILEEPGFWNDIQEAVDNFGEGVSGFRVLERYRLPDGSERYDLVRRQVAGMGKDVVEFFDGGYVTLEGSAPVHHDHVVSPRVAEQIERFAEAAAAAVVVAEQFERFAEAATVAVGVVEQVSALGKP